MDRLPDNKTDHLHLYVLDPLSVIIKLAILSNKPIGTKLCIDNNIIYTQEPGPFQALCRYLFKNNKTDIQYLYNPIEFACQFYLSPTCIKQNPKITDLFKCAQQGLNKLSETYRSCSIIRLCIHHYYSLIDNHLEEHNNGALFRKDHMTVFYTDDLLNRFVNLWSDDKIKIILNLTNYLASNANAETDVKSLETIIEGIDHQVALLI